MSDSISRINTAIDGCLEWLDKSADPRAELRAYLELAQSEGILSPEELRTVETAVFRIIQDRETRGR